MAGRRNGRETMHDFTRTSGYVSYGGNRYKDHKDALNAAFANGVRRVVILNDADVSFMRWYYDADACGKWQQAKGE